MKAVLQPIEQSVPDLERFTNQLKKRLECLKLSQQNFKCTLDMIIQIGVLTNREFPKECHVFCSQDKDLSEFIKKVNFRCQFWKRKKENNFEKGVGVAATIKQLRTCVIKIVTFKAGHLMW